MRQPLQASGATFGAGDEASRVSTAAFSAAALTATDSAAAALTAAASAFASCTASSFSGDGGLKMRLARDPSGACKDGKICCRGWLAPFPLTSRELTSDSIWERNSLE